MFCIDFTDRRARVRRARNERFVPVCVAEHDRYDKGSVMVWAGISMQGKTDLQIIENGTFTTVRYVNEILDFYVRPYAGAIGADSFFWTIMRAHTEHTSLTNIWKMLPSLAHSPRHEHDRESLGHASESDFCLLGPANNCSAAQNSATGGMGQTHSATARLAYQ